jgi:hypothetical protein
MSRLYNTFEFIGNMVLPNDSDRIHTVDEFSSGWIKHKLNFGIQESKLNTVFLDLEGWCAPETKSAIVYSFSKGLFGEKGSNLEIPWKDRNEESTLDMVADFSKIIVDLETDTDVKDEYMKLYYKIRSLENKKDATDEDKEKLKNYKAEFKEKATRRYEFLHEYDVIKFLEEMLIVNQDRKFRVTGNVQWNEWKGKYYRKFIPKLIEIVPDDAKNQLRANIDIFFNRDAIDKSMFKDEKKIIINGYIQDYVREEKADRFFPQTFIINGANLDLEDENHVKRLGFVTNSFKASGREYYHLQCLTSIYRGAETVDFTYDDLTQTQKEAVDLGLNKVNDFAPRGGFIGGNLDEIRILKPILKNDFIDGAVSTDLKEDEFMELIVKDTSDVKLEDIKEEKKEENQGEKEETNQDLDAMLDDLLS